MEIHHVQLAMPSDGEDEAREFYGNVIGLRERQRPSSLSTVGVWFGTGSFELHLGVEEAFEPARKAHPAILVRDLDRIAARLDGAGADVRYDDRLPGYRRFYTDDPFGNRLEFLEPTGESDG